MRKTVIMKYLVIYIVLFLASCTTSYKSPLEGPTTAVLYIDQHEFSSGRFGRPQSQAFVTYDDENCSGIPASLGALGRYNRAVKPIVVPSGKRFFLKTMYMDIGGPVPDGFTRNGFGVYSCINVVSFIPEARHEYSVLQTPDSLACSTSIKDLSLLQVPSDFVVHPITAGCKNR